MDEWLEDWVEHQSVRYHEDENEKLSRKIGLSWMLGSRLWRGRQ